jgi:ribosome-binding protein aMBF1 (putative translation factor)
MSVLSRSETEEILFAESADAARSSASSDLDLPAKIGKRIQARRILCGLSKQQLGARLGIRGADVNAYEQGAKRVSCELLLETAKQLKATPRFFFSDL